MGKPMDHQQKANTAPPTSKKLGHRYAKGHPLYPPRHDRPPSLKRQRKTQADVLADMLEQMARRHRAGESVDPQAYATLLNAQRRLLQER